ncbi:hypothetical protein L9G74_00335 [Shewanella sp. C32]|uniref:DUF3108 domain-containing protein n=1 Tax=Shewanella electrica TaxID=515560 RepID=A0ABT2FI17_9GAMM|nr:hypothetical protein [Shewanella electrica]MCH1925057.1 hypothetical protein [Shewanella electrica]MCS4554881.1 hypothetical protein [Shewanella electrica]
MRIKHSRVLPLIGLLAAAVLPMQSMAKTTAEACFNADLYQEGNQYRLVSPKTSAMLSYYMPAPDNFNGQPVVREQESYAATKYSDPSISTYQYQLDKQQLQRRELAVVWRENGRDKYIEHTPAKVMPFNLGVGEQFSQTVAAKFDGSGGGNQLKFTWTFVGMEPLTVAAGEFSTCHFEQITEVTDASGESQTFHASHWFAAQSGVPVKMVTQKDTFELESAVIAGQHFPQ